MSMLAAPGLSTPAPVHPSANPPHHQEYSDDEPDQRCAEPQPNSDLRKPVPQGIDCSDDYEQHRFFLALGSNHAIEIRLNQAPPHPPADTADTADGVIDTSSEGKK
ncbi:hypothetical protein [Actinoplanes sp. NPDC049802]|uniref:hypothetical protein n=1 Tax=Actinoplanes sp. NPDC049802 TaxID=3154742 RepID=UPI0033F4B53B